MKHSFYLLYFCCISIVLAATPGFSKEWSKQEVPLSAAGATFHSVCFINSTHGWTVGEKGVVLTTEDGGNTWIDLTEDLRQQMAESIPGPVTFNFFSVMFVDALAGWCAGEAVPAFMGPVDRKYKVIFHTTDGGRTWTCQYPRSSDIYDIEAVETGSINDIYFLDRRHGWATGTGASYLLTSDGGNTWEKQGLDFYVFPEMKMAMTSSKWLSPCFGMITGYSWDMNEPDYKRGFIATTVPADIPCAGDPEWKIDSGDEHGWAPLNDIEIQTERDGKFSAWVAGDRGIILKRTPEGRWERCPFPPWPLAFTLPDFKGINFSDLERGWAAGYFRKSIAVDPEDASAFMTIFKTLDAGGRWQPEPVDIKGTLNDISALDTRLKSPTEKTRVATDAWAVGTDGTILHYHNSPPLICSLNPRPSMVYAGESFTLQARVDDWDNPFEDIVSVIADASSLGLGSIELKPVETDLQDRRCILYQAVIDVPGLSEYGNHAIEVTVTDSDNAVDKAETSVFVVTSWVDILDAWAEPPTLPAGQKARLNARVILVAPKDDDSPALRNRIESVKVNVSDLLGIDCTEDADCAAWIPMEYDPESGLYTTVSQAIIPGCHSLPVVATDTLGHTDRYWIPVCVTQILFDYDKDKDVDGLDLFMFIQSGDFERPGNMKAFSLQFGWLQ